MARYKANRQDMRQALIHKYVREYHEKFPNMSDERIQKRAINKYNRVKRKMIIRSTIAALVVAGAVAGTTAGVNAIKSNNNLNPDKSIETQLDDLSSNDLKTFTTQFSDDNHPESLDGTTEEEKAKEQKENTIDSADDFVKYQNGMKAFIAEYKRNPDKFTEQDFLSALETSQNLLDKYAKNNIVNLMYEYNESLPEKDIDLKFIDIPDPSDVNYFVPISENEAPRQSLAVTSYDTNGLKLDHYLYFDESFKDNGFDHAISNYFENSDFIEKEQSKLDKKPDDNKSKSQMDKMCSMILDNSDVYTKIAQTGVTKTKHWFSDPSINYEYVDSHDLEKQEQENYEDLTSKEVTAENTSVVQETIDSSHEENER